MKKLFLLGLSAILFFNCEKPKQRYFSESPEINSFKAAVSEYNNGDWDTWHTHYADTTKFYINSLKSITATDLENAQKEMLSNFSSYGFQDKGSFIEMVLDSDEETWVNYWANWHGTLKDNGKEIDVPVHITAQFVDGKIVKFYDYFDPTPINTAVAEINAYNAMPADEKTIMDIVDKVVIGWNAHKIDNLKSVSVENLVRTTNGIVQANNINEYEEMMNSLVTAFPDLKVALDKAVIKDNKIYINWTVSGTNNGVFAGNPATGKKLNIHGFSVWSLNADGKLTREDAYFDNLLMFNQLGLTPPKS
ncbi:hypothetical protein GCM10007962_25450 [Yeosuana aromativorans]|uniref:SnoaL-like polyketide cyclase n=1 Tax=Yeosuana aromativorans TaxID=288019 RepID=A0A8J3BPU5_9FLAO|nr:ester cyclase [Yeosuana aromativorans]GGK30067.1 hypothetical protein GCM10007962_25450 [Yeosuana aromativorans]